MNILIFLLTLISTTPWVYASNIKPPPETATIWEVKSDTSTSSHTAYTTALDCSNVGLVDEDLKEINKTPEFYNKINLANNLLQRLPLDFIQYKYLASLDISDNSIKVLPKGFSPLKALQVLNISNNQISDITVATGLSLLRILIASNNHITTINMHSWKCTNLQQLDLIHNRISTFLYGESKNIKVIFPQLKMIDLSRNKITSLPTSLVKMKKLHTLCIFGNSALELTKYQELFKHIKLLRVDTNQLRIYGIFLQSMRQTHGLLYEFTRI